MFHCDAATGRDVSPSLGKAAGLRVVRLAVTKMTQALPHLKD
jgi:hypothetical protein